MLLFGAWIINYSFQRIFVMYKKLNKISLRVLLLLRVLVILIPVVTLLSWIFSENIFSESILGPSIGELIKADQVNIFKLNNKLIGIAGSFFNLLPFVLSLVWLIRLFKNYAIGDIFTVQNAKIYSHLGYVCLLSALVFQPISQALFSLAVSINYAVGQRFIAFGFGGGNLTAIIGGAFLIVIAYVMRIGHEINEERNLTI